MTKYDVFLYITNICAIINLIFAKFRHFCGNFSAIFFNGRIMFFGWIDIFMAEHIRNQLDVSGFTVKIRSVSASEFMRGDVF